MNGLMTTEAPARTRAVVEIADGRIAMRSPYNPDLVARQRAIPGRRWDAANKINTFPAGARRQVLDVIDAFADMGWQVTRDALAVLNGQEPPPPPPKPTVQPGYKVRVEWLDRDHTAVGVRFSHDPVMLNEIRAVPEREWDTSRGCSAVKLTQDSAVKLTEFLSRHRPVICETGVRERILELAREGVERNKVRRLMKKLSKAEDSEFMVDGLGGELRPFQRAGVDYVLRADCRTFIADAPGTGKTVQALASILAADKFPAVVVCPAAVKLSWRDHVEGPPKWTPESPIPERGWLPGRKVKVLTGETPDAAKVYAADVVVVNWDIIGAWRETLETILKPRAAVFDESHYAKSASAVRTQEALALAEAVRVRDGMVLNLTGTAVLNKPTELVAQLDLLGRLDEFGGRKGINKRRSGERLNEELRSTCFIRRLKKDVMKELPEKQVARVSMALSNWAEYAQVETDVINWLMDQIEKDEEFAAEIAHLPEDVRKQRVAARQSDTAARAARAERLVKMSALKKVCMRGKLKGATAWVRNFLDSSEEKLIVFASHVEAQETLLKAFPGAAHLMGADSAQVRDSNIRRFQTDPKCRLFVGSLAAGGIGITLTAASNVAFLELGWTPAEHDQAEDRCHRMGQKGSVTAWYLMADGTIDDDSHAIIESKRSVVTSVTDGVAVNREGSILSELEARLVARGKERAR